MIPAIGSEIEIAIDGLDLDGTGVGRRAGLEVRVARALPGDRVRARIEGVSRHQPTAFASLIEIVAPAPGRRPSPCPVSDRCDGCALIELDQPAQASAKLELLRRQLSGVLPDALLPDRVVETPPALGYRRRAKFVVARVDGAVRLGAYARRSHRFVPTEPCPVVTPAIASALPAIATAIERQDVAIAADGQPGLRYLQLRGSDRGELLVTLVSHQPSGPLQRAADDIARDVPSVTGVTLDLNPSSGDAILAGQGRLLAGRGELIDTVAGVPVALGPYDFVQLHGPAGDRLGQSVADLITTASPGPVIDLFSGVGALAFAIALRGRRTIAVERQRSALRAGRAAAQRARLEIEHAAADGAEFLSGLAASGMAPPVIVVDPPRRGLTDDALRALLALPAHRLIYVSCWPRALARDLQRLSAGGYRALAVEAHDLFPQTPAVEALVELGR
ncbi:MAG: 23S rRNA (uracil(1939)-C(5))-methyltransferase RlmD [Deltaproteobacteria bacterium]|nr:23S rRNA (uracil(1939)-C(5))-methyltransferase RlmD [Deltaproteobacteria bacterium]